MSVIHSLGLLMGAVLLVASPVRGDDASGVFGQSQMSEAALIGIMYDLKQTPTHQPTPVNPGTYFTVLDEFVRDHWDDAVLERYYRVSRPLYTTQIFIPNMDANDAPKAFGAEKVVKPSLWVIHYKAQVSAPKAGTYRFWGSADDALAVAVNGKTELIAWLRQHTNNNGWKQTDPDGAQAADDFLRPGDWFTLADGDIMDLDVIIGENPGGQFNAFLLVEQKGATYEKDAQGHSIFPIFQVAEHITTHTNDAGSAPRFADGFPPWKSYQ